MTRRVLTPAMLEVVQMLDDGLDLEAIAERTGLSESTIRARLRRVARIVAGDRYVKWDDLPRLVREQSIG